MLVVSKTGTNLATEKVFAAAIAQLVEHLICNQRVGSSSLSGGTTFPQYIQLDNGLSPDAPVCVIRLGQRWCNILPPQSVIQ